MLIVKNEKNGVTYELRIHGEISNQFSLVKLWCGLNY